MARPNKRHRDGIDEDTAAGVGAACRSAYRGELKTAYPPELAAQARFDAIIEQMKAAKDQEGRA